MINIKPLFAAVFLCLLLTGCGVQIPEPILQPSESEEQLPDHAPDSTVPSIPEDDTFPPDKNMIRSRLTNEWISRDAAAIRPLAVMIPNESAALPHYQLSKASILYEANVEGRMTRLMAIYEDWEALQKIGNIRSLRTYYAYWALEWDAFIVHWGGPFFVSEVLDKPDVENLDGLLEADTNGFFRTTDRKDPHNVYANGSDLKALIEQKEFSLAYRGLTDDSHYRFTAKADPNTLSQYPDARKATRIDMSGCYPLTRCYFEYQEEDGLYYRFQHLSGSSDGPHLDSSTGEQLAFRNILVQYIKYKELGEGYLAFQCHDTTLDGWFFTEGKGIHVTWEKTSDFGATRYYDDYGNEVVLNTGKTMVLIVEEGDQFTFE